MDEGLLLIVPVLILLRFPGHDRLVVQFTRDYFHHFLVRSTFFPDSLTEAMKDAYRQTERSFMALAPSRGWESGCTAVTALVQGDRLTVGHVGDSRIVLCRQGRAIALTKDHSPNDSDELERIEKEGAVVKNGMVRTTVDLSKIRRTHCAGFGFDRVHFKWSVTGFRSTWGCPEHW